MSITGSMYTGAAGLTSHSDAMSVISDNIANVNTVGFKSGRANFTDMLGNVIAGQPSGSGSRIGSVQTNYSQGALLGTGNVTDLAIQGDGFFMVEGVVDGVRSTYYTRAGQFLIDDQGYLVNSEKLRVQGNPIDANGNLLNSVGDLSFEFNSIPPEATTEVELVANLDAEQPVSTATFDITDPAGTSDFSTQILVYDSLGNKHELELYFNKTQQTPNPIWEYHVLTAGPDVGGAAGTWVELTDGSGATPSIEFDANGAVVDYSMTSIDAAWLGANAETIDLNLGTSTASGGNGVDGVTSYGLKSAVTFSSQDGYPSGDLAGLEIDQTGLMSGLFSNGQSRMLGRVSLAGFANVDGLSRRGAGLYAATNESGSPVVGEPSSGGRGSVASGNLESSNVDLAREFVDMISVQRGFQSNSRSITTADEMLSEVLSLKR
ncbi:MAG: flagellar hook protein FlgE [Myxococcales bacterium FL481]|nr:MAG: flagellar hook protein FlgE [Myxococcales bacterium FL481]